MATFYMAFRLISTFRSPVMIVFARRFISTPAASPAEAYNACASCRRSVVKYRCRHFGAGSRDAAAPPRYKSAEDQASGMMVVSGRPPRRSASPRLRVGTLSGRLSGGCSRRSAHSVAASRARPPHRCGVADSMILATRRVWRYASLAVGVSHAQRLRSSRRGCPAREWGIAAFRFFGFMSSCCCGLTAGAISWASRPRSFLHFSADWVVGPAVAASAFERCAR